jgi:hypothetical protein
MITAEASRVMVTDTPSGTEDATLITASFSREFVSDPRATSARNTFNSEHIAWYLKIWRQRVGIASRRAPDSQSLQQVFIPACRTPGENRNV